MNAAPLLLAAAVAAAGPALPTRHAPAGPTPVLVADAGPDLMAYVGDRVILRGEGQGSEFLQYAWSQVGGPPVDLTDPTLPNPSFDVTSPGTIVLELVVSDGGSESEPDRLYVASIRKDAGTVYTPAKRLGCAVAPVGGGWLLAVAGALVLRGRRRDRRSA